MSVSLGGQHVRARATYHQGVRAVRPCQRLVRARATAEPMVTTKVGSAPAPPT